MQPEEEQARQQLFAEMPEEKLAAIAWLRARVEHVDRETMGTRRRLDATTNPVEQEALERELMTGLWIRGAALERANELMIELAPERRPTLEKQVANARAEQQIARQRLWGDPSRQ